MESGEWRTCTVNFQLSKAACIDISYSSAGVMPMARACLGTMLSALWPGIVLTSRKYNSSHPFSSPLEGGWGVLMHIIFYLLITVSFERRGKSTGMGKTRIGRCREKCGVCGGFILHTYER